MGRFVSMLEAMLNFMTVLSKFEVMRSSDLAELQEMISKFSSPVQLTINRKGDEIDATMALAHVGNMALMRGTFGEARVDWYSEGECADTMLLFAPTKGGGEITHLGQTWELSTDVGMMRDLGLEATAYQEQFHSFVVPISKTRMRDHARSLGGEQLGLYTIDFDPVADFTSAGGQLIKQYLAYLANGLEQGLIDIDNALVTSQMCDLLLTQLLTQLKNNVQDALTGQDAAYVVPRYVKRVQEYIHANPADALDMSTLSLVGGCSYRTLQRGFIDAFDLTPKQYIRQVRLQLVRKDLLSNEGVESVSTIARRWGFGHLGRFAQEYAQEFGELPAKTARHS